MSDQRLAGLLYAVQGDGRADVMIDVMIRRPDCVDPSSQSEEEFYEREKFECLCVELQQTNGVGKTIDYSSISVSPLSIQATVAGGRETPTAAASDQARARPPHVRALNTGIGTPMQYSTYENVESENRRNRRKTAKW